MKELLSYLFPFFVVCLILFVVTRIWVALVDTVIGWGKRLLHPEGGNKVSVKWHIARPAIPADTMQNLPWSALSLRSAGGHPPPAVPRWPPPGQDRWSREATLR